MDRLLAALDARIRRVAESGDPSGVLDPDASAEAARLWEAAQSADGDPHAVSVDALTVLAGLHFARYQALPAGQGQDLRIALGLYDMLADRAPGRIPAQIRDLLAAAQPEHPAHAEYLMATGAEVFGEYLQTGRPKELDAALTAFRDAVAAAPHGHPDLAVMLALLAAALRERSERTGDVEDLDAAIDAGQRAVDLTPPGDPGLARHLSNLGGVLLGRFERTGNVEDLDAAIDAGQRAVDLIPPGDPHLATMLWNLGAYLHGRFERAGDATDLDAAISSWQRAGPP